MIGINDKRVLFGCLAALSLMCVTACGGNITITDDENIIEPPPSDARSVGILSGFGYSEGGEHYKMVHSLGSPLAESLQTSVDGRYKVK